MTYYLEFAISCPLPNQVTFSINPKEAHALLTQLKVFIETSLDNHPPKESEDTMIFSRLIYFSNNSPSFINSPRRLLYLSKVLVCFFLIDDQLESLESKHTILYRNIFNHPCSRLEHVFRQLIENKLTTFTDPSHIEDVKTAFLNQFKSATRAPHTSTLREWITDRELDIGLIPMLRLNQALLGIDNASLKPHQKLIHPMIQLAMSIIRRHNDIYSLHKELKNKNITVNPDKRVNPALINDIKNTVVWTAITTHSSIRKTIQSELEASNQQLSKLMYLFRRVSEHPIDTKIKEYSYLILLWPIANLVWSTQTGRYSETTQAKPLKDCLDLQIFQETT